MSTVHAIARFLDEGGWLERDINKANQPDIAISVFGEKLAQGAAVGIRSTSTIVGGIIDDSGEYVPERKVPCFTMVAAYERVNPDYGYDDPRRFTSYGLEFLTFDEAWACAVALNMHRGVSEPVVNLGGWPDGRE